eukprot:scaffold3642_cov27-Phaeocystis_antarctica.AAC.2
MGPKKQHEVLRLAPLIAAVARRCGASAVVDVGSGMGCAPPPYTLTTLAMASHALSTRTPTLHSTPYAFASSAPTRADLSHVLALHYGLTVVGIDAEESNTKGAEVRRVRERPAAAHALEAATLC